MEIVHFQQTDPGGRLSCVPACVKMLYEAQGVEVSEEELCDILKTDQFGTPLSHLRFLTENLVADLEFVWERATVSELEELVAIGETPMITIAAPESEKSLWLHRSVHTVLVVKIDASQIWINDPRRLSGPTKVPSADLLELWLAANSVLFTLRKSG